MVKEVHNHSDGGGGGGSAMIGVIAGCALVALALFFFFGYARNDSVAVKAPTVIEKSVPVPSTTGQK